MRTLSVFLIGCLALLLVVGCSDKQKEAARLEQEMKDMAGAGDTVAAAVETAVDTAASAEAVVDVSAVPDEPAVEAMPMPPVPDGLGYTVQVASCENDEYARHLVGVYGGRGYDAFVSTITFEGQTFHRVRIGNFGAFSEAKALKAELADRYSLETWIDRLDQ